MTIDDNELKEARARLNNKPWRQWFDLIRSGFTEPRKSNAAPARDPLDWRAFGVFAALLVTFVVAFAWSLADMASGIHAGDPLAPFMALGAVIAAAAIGAFAAGSIAMFFTQE